MLKEIQTACSKYACNIFILHCKWFLHSKALRFSELVEFKNFYVKFFISKTFKIVGGI